MKAWKKILCIIAGVVALVGAIVVIATLAVCGFNFNKIVKTQTLEDLGYVEEIITSQNPASSYNSVIIEASCQEVYFSSGDVSNIQATYTTNGVVTPEIKDAEGVFSIDIAAVQGIVDYSSTLFFPRDGYNYNAIDVVVPRNYAGTIVVRNQSGDISICDMTSGANFDLSTTSGFITISDCTCGNVVAESNSGEICLYKVLAQTLAASTTSGCICVEESEIQASNLSTTSGSISCYLVGSYESYDPAFDTKSNSGDVVITSEERDEALPWAQKFETHSLKCSTTSGDIYLTFYVFDPMEYVE